MNRSRRQFLRTTAFGLASAPLVTPVRAFAQGAPFKIGFLAPLTGPFAKVGKDMVNGTELFLDEIGRQMAGRKVELIVEDDEGQPASALTKSRKLVEQDKVHLLTGGLLANVGYALQPFIDGSGIPATYPVIASDDITQRKPAKWIVRTGWSTSQPMHPFAEWVIKNTKYRKVATIGMDYAFGYETVGGFQKIFEDCGGKVIQKIWPPLGTKDFGPYIPNIKADADMIFTTMVGPMALQFPKQLRAAGIKTPIVASGVSYDEFVLPFMGDEVIGDVSALHYSAALETPENEKFVKAYRAKYGKVPSYYSENNYTTAMWIDEAMKKAGGKYPGPEQFIKLMESIKLNAPRGPVELDDMRNPIENVYIKKVEKKTMFGYEKDELWNTVIKTYPDVSQFWTYGKETFLKQPVYSRDFPPCKYCE